MDTKPLLALSWLFVVLMAICASLMFVLTSVRYNIENYSAAVCIDGQLRAVSAGGQAYLLRDRSGNPMTCETQ